MMNPRLPNHSKSSRNQTRKLRGNRIIVDDSESDSDSGKRSFMGPHIPPVEKPLNMRPFPPRYTRKLYNPEMPQYEKPSDRDRGPIFNSLKFTDAEIQLDELMQSMSSSVPNVVTRNEIISQEGTYEGTMSKTDDTIKHGKGIMNYKNGDIYGGEWSNDKKHGKGLFVDNANNTIYYGDFANGHKQGFGIIILSDQSIIVGEWSEGDDQPWTTLQVDANQNIIGSSVAIDPNEIVPYSDDGVEIRDKIYEDKGIILDRNNDTIYLGKIFNGKKHDKHGFEYNYFTLNLFVGEWKEDEKKDFEIECNFNIRTKKYDVEIAKSKSKSKSPKNITKKHNKPSSSFKEDFKLEDFDGGKRRRKQRRRKSRKN